MIWNDQNDQHGESGRVVATYLHVEVTALLFRAFVIFFISYPLIQYALSLNPLCNDIWMISWSYVEV